MMKIFRRLVLLLLVIGLAVCVHSCRETVGNSYYIDPSSRSQMEDGSREHPFKSFEKLSQLTLGRGDCILLAGGVEHRGPLSVENVKADKEHPLLIGSYGKGRAVINAGRGTGVRIARSEFVTVRNLSIHGSGYRSEDGNDGSGLHCVASRYMDIDSILCTGFLWNGVLIEDGDHHRVRNVYASKNGYFGINISASDVKKRTQEVYVGYCTAENNPGCYKITDNHSGSGILLAHVSQATVEYCEAMNNGWAMPREGNGPVGIWAFEADHVTIQYCYAHDNKTSAKGKDGGGFDLDGGITNCILQYNLSMNNEGAGYGLFQYAGATTWSDNQILHNVSINDGSKNSHTGIFVWCDAQYESMPMCNTRVSGNKIISSHGSAVHFETGFSRNLLFEGNQFCLTDGSKTFVTGDRTKQDAIFRGNDSIATYQPTQWETPAKVELQDIKSVVERISL